MLITTEIEYPGGDARLRKNTVRVDFSFLTRDLTIREMHHFVEHRLLLPTDQVAFMQWNSIERCIYLRMSNLYAARRLVAIHDRRHTFPARWWRWRVGLTLVDVPSEVLLLDLSELVTDDEIMGAMEQYGVVLSIAHSHWGPGVRYSGIPSGQRLVRMVVRKKLPGYLRIGNELSTVNYIEKASLNHTGFRYVQNMIRGWRFMEQVVLTSRPV